METKRCPRCKQHKPATVEYFYGNKTRPGFSSRCIQCTTEASREYYMNNKQKVMDRAHKWAKDNPERYRSHRARKRRKERLNPLVRLGDALRCGLRNALKDVNAYKSGRKFNEMTGFTTEQYADRLNDNSYGYTVANAKRDNLHVDHIVPVAFARCEYEVIMLSHPTNLRLLPASQNTAKRDNLPAIQEIPVDIDRKVLAIYYRELRSRK